MDSIADTNLLSGNMRRILLDLLCCIRREFGNRTGCRTAEIIISSCVVAITQQHGMCPLGFMRYIFNIHEPHGSRYSVLPPLASVLQYTKTQIITCKNRVGIQNDSIVLCGSAATSLANPRIFPNDFDLLCDKKSDIKPDTDLAEFSLFFTHPMTEDKEDDLKIYPVRDGTVFFFSRKIRFGNMCINILMFTKDYSICKYIDRFDTIEGKRIIYGDGTLCGFDIDAMTPRGIPGNIVQSDIITIHMNAIRPVRFLRYAKAVGIYNIRCYFSKHDGIDGTYWRDNCGAECMCYCNLQKCPRHKELWENHFPSVVGIKYIKYDKKNMLRIYSFIVGS